jgi:hypothetical protein
VDAWLAAAGAAVLRYTTADEVMADALRGRPELAVLDARGDALPGVLAACERLKRDAFTAILPVAAIADDVAAVTRLLAAGADEALRRRLRRRSGTPGSTRSCGAPRAISSCTRPRACPGRRRSRRSWRAAWRR